MGKKVSARLVNSYFMRRVFYWEGSLGERAGVFYAIDFLFFWGVLSQCLIAFVHFLQNLSFHGSRHHRHKIERTYLSTFCLQFYAVSLRAVEI